MRDVFTVTHYGLLYVPLPPVKLLLNTAVLAADGTSTGAATRATSRRPCLPRSCTALGR